MGIMEGKICVITGGGGSLGLESARELLREGASVMLVDNHKENLEKAIRSLGRDSKVLSSFLADVSKTPDTRKYIEKTVQSWGKIDAGHRCDKISELCTSRREIVAFSTGSVNGPVDFTLVTSTGINKACCSHHGRFLQARSSLEPRPGMSTFRKPRTMVEVASSSLRPLDMR
jgi:NAD(P)-dependent dehydrogenase (short-subunit alcohol dehydrogenase family)